MYDLRELIAQDGFLDGFRESLDLEAPPPVLREAKIKLTSRCNLRCRMCHYWKTKHEEVLSTDQWRRVLDELAALGCRKVHFSGGEVFLRRDFLDLVEHSTSLGLKTNLTTNGTLLDKTKARRLVKARVNSVSVSLDGPTSGVHDRIRGVDGAFRRTLRTVRWIRRYSAESAKPVKLRVNFVVMRRNYRRLPEMVELAGRLGAIDLHPMPVDEKGERRNRLSRTQIEKYNRDVAPRVLALRRDWGFPLTADKVHPFGVTPREVRYSKRGLYARGFFESRACLVPWLHAFLAWNGDVFLCCMTNGRMDPLGNVLRDSVSGVFHGEAYRSVRKRFLDGRHRPECHRCDLFLRENAELHRALERTEADQAASSLRASC